MFGQPVQALPGAGVGAGGGGSPFDVVALVVIVGLVHGPCLHVVTAVQSHSYTDVWIQAGDGAR